MTTDPALRVDEPLDQRAFRRWLSKRPASDLNHYELIHGRIVMAPPAGWPHGGIEASITGPMQQHVRLRKLGIVLGSSTGYDLPSGDTLEPDVSFVSARRLAAGPKPVTGHFVRFVPNLVVEILSPATARRDCTEKKRVYEQNGVEEYWIVDPLRRQVTVYRRGRRTFGPGRSFSSGRIMSRVLPELALAVEEVFAA